MSQPVSCSTLLKTAHGFASGMPASEQFFAGFVIGQYEKVYLGCCPAAMFTIPSSGDSGDRMRAFIFQMAHTYELRVRWTKASDKANEVWVYRADASPRIPVLVDEQRRLLDTRNTEAAHAIRATLCGIPAHRLDPWWSPPDTGPVPLE